MSLGYRVLYYLSYNTYARKTVGYLYAIEVQMLFCCFCSIFNQSLEVIFLKISHRVLELQDPEKKAFLIDNAYCPYNSVSTTVLHCQHYRAAL